MEQFVAHLDGICGLGRGPRMRPPTLRPGQGMPPQGDRDEREPDSRGDQPICQGRELPQQREVGAVVHVERGQEQDVGPAHPDQMPPYLLTPDGSASGNGGRQGERPEHEQMVVLRPPNRRKPSHGDPDDHSPR